MDYLLIYISASNIWDQYSVSKPFFTITSCTVTVTKFMDFTWSYTHNGLFAECGVLDNLQGLCGPRTRTRTCKLVLKDPRGQGLSSRTTTLTTTTTTTTTITMQNADGPCQQNCGSCQNLVAETRAKRRRRVFRQTSSIFFHSLLHPVLRQLPIHSKLEVSIKYPTSWP